jgi:hypothetical protein
MGAIPWLFGLDFIQDVLGFAVALRIAFARSLENVRIELRLSMTVMRYIAGAKVKRQISRMAE